MTRFGLIVLLLFCMGFVDQPLENPREEARALKLMDEIRCAVCENEPISQSRTQMAADMRQRVRLLIEDGASNAEVRAWFEDRYGAFILFRPPLQGYLGIALWGLPFLFLLIAGGVIFALRVGRRKTQNIETVEADAFDPAPPE